jgi:hypothetical protein
VAGFERDLGSGRQRGVIATQGICERHPDETPSWNQTAAGKHDISNQSQRVTILTTVFPIRIVVKHDLGRIIAVIEIVSPGNKDSRAALRDFVEKTVDFLLIPSYSPGRYNKKSG